MWIPGSVLTVPALFLAGAVSSAHCVLMCGALGTLQLQSPRLPARASLPWLYGGRLIGYAGMGAIAGSLGQSALLRLPGPWTGQILQGAAALLLVLIGLRYIFRGGPKPECCKPPAPPHISSLPTRLSLLLRGLLWAALPCGVLYSILLLAAFSGSAAAGSMLLAAFALGGTPALAAATTWSATRRGTALSTRRAGYWLVGFGVAGAAAAALMSTWAAPYWCRALLGGAT